MSRLHLYFLLILREPHVEFAMLRGRSLPPVHGEELRLGLSGPGFAPEIRVNAVLCGWVWNVDLLQPGLALEEPTVSFMSPVFLH